MKKRAKVHLLPTDKESHITFDKESSSCYSYGLHYLENASGSSNRTKTERQHLYITTDDEIKKGDWYYNERLNKVFQAISNSGYNTVDKESKIIATTDPELTINISRPLGVTQQLPQPSKAFIEKYCKVGGIDEVDVEYGLFHDGNFKDDDETHAFKAIRKPRVNSHNEITIHPIKDS